MSRELIESLFNQALDLTGNERAAFLADACADSEMRREIESLLAHDSAAGCTFLDRLPTQDLLDTLDTLGSFSMAPPAETRQHFAPDDDTIPKRIGRYQVRRKIGEGGMGVVYEAEQEHPRRLVALKVVHPGMGFRQIIRRFEREAQVLGQLRHPGIAQIYEAGVADMVTCHGIVPQQPYFAMELLRGTAIDVHSRQRGLPLRDRLDLFSRVCDAMDYAHGKGVIHRDLKPGNILVDELGHPKVLDFGVARVANAEVQLTVQTDVGQLVGTLAYMSPEQVAGNSHEVDVRSDVYALGVVLYELVAGKPAYDLRGQTLPEALRVIREDEPTRLGSLDTRFRGDVETIVAKALQKDRGRRYSSTAELAADLRRYLEHEPIVARPASMFYQLRKFARRHRGLTVGLALTLLTLTLGVVATTTFALHAQRQRRLADDRATLVERQSYRANLAAAQRALSEHNVDSAVRYLEAAPSALRGWEWKRLRSITDRSLYTFRLDAVPARFWAVTNEAVITLRSRELSFHDIQSGEVQYRIDCAIEDPLVFSLQPFGQIVALESTTEIVLQQARDGRELWRRAVRSQHEDLPQITFSGDGRLIVLPDAESNRVLLLDSITGEEVDALTIDGRPRCCGISPDGQIIYVQTQDGGWFIERTTRRILWRRGVQRSTFSPDARLVACWSENSRTGEFAWTMHEGPTGKLLATIDVRMGTAALAFHPDASLMATVEIGGEITLRDTATFEPVSELRSPGAMANRVAFTPDGRFLLALDRSGRTVRAWEGTPTPDAMIVRANLPGRNVLDFRISPDGRRVAARDWGTLTMFDATGGGCLWTRCLSRVEAAGFAFSPDSSRVAVVVDGGRIAVLDVGNGSVVARSGPVAKGDIDWTYMGLIVVGVEGLVGLEPEGLNRIPGLIPRLTEADFTLVGNQTGVALIAGPESVQLLQVGRADGALTSTLRHLAGRHEGLVSAALDSRRERLALGDAAGRIRLWDLRSGHSLADVSVALSEIRALAFSNDGSRLAAASRERITLLDTDVWEPVDSLDPPRDESVQVRFTPQDQALICTGLGTPVLRYERTSPRENGRDLYRVRELNRRAAQRVSDAAVDYRTSGEIVTALTANTRPTELRDAAIDFAHSLGDNPNWLNSDAWGIVLARDQPTEYYRPAVLFAEIAVSQLPDAYSLLNTLGAAQYRAGDFADAIATMERADQVYDHNGGEAPRGPHPANRVFIAMAHARLGQGDDARRELAAIRRLMLDARYCDDQETLQFVREAEELIDLP